MDQNNKNELATAGMVCSLLGFLGLTALYGVILSFFGLSKSKELNGIGRKESILGIIVGLFFLFVFVLALAYVDEDQLEYNDYNNTPTEEKTTITEEKSTTTDEKNTTEEESSSSTSPNTSKTPPKTDEEIKNEFIAGCQVLTYEEIARNPDNYYGTKAAFTGEVVQVQEGILKNVVLRVNVTKQEYQYIDTVTWKDTIYVEYKYKDGESKILDDDIVTIYGTLKGSKTYTTVLGASVTIPRLDAKYIILNQ